VLICERFGARLTGAVKSNSSGFEVWRGSLVLTGSRSSGGLIEERLNIESTSTWIRGDRQVTETTVKIPVSHLWFVLLCSFTLCNLHS
jgi:hypothetical protein